MKITILGNGGALNDGLPYNAFLIDNTTLVETPPDIMLSLQREKIEYSSIQEIYISHLHGDHCFGFPFLALSLFRSRYNKSAKKIKLFAPKDGKGYFLDLAERALSNINPCIQWIYDTFEFKRIHDDEAITLANCGATLFRMDHYEETYGFVLTQHGRNLFAYSGDTKWCATLEDMIRHAPQYMLIDLNGEPYDVVKVHLGERELVEKIDGKYGETVFLGTHLKSQKEKSSHNNINYVHPGMVFDIGEFLL